MKFNLRRYITAPETKHVVHHLRALDADGDGRVTLPELYQAFRMAEIKVVKPAPAAPKAAAAAPGPGPGRSQAWAPEPTAAHGGAGAGAGAVRGGGGGDGGASASEVAHLREAASEVAVLRQQLRDTKARSCSWMPLETRVVCARFPHFKFKCVVKPLTNVAFE